MLYFKVVVFPAGVVSPTPSCGEGVAEVMTDLPDVEIEAAAAFVVRRLHSEGWRISHVLEARPLTRTTRFTEAALNRLFAEAADSGFSFGVTPVTVRSDVAVFEPTSSQGNTRALDEAEEAQRTG